MMATFSEDMLIRMELTALTEPGNPVTGQLVRAIGLTETLALIRDPGSAIPAAVDPLQGVRWRQAAAARQADALRDQIAELTDRHEFRALTPGGAGWPVALNDLGDRAPLMLWAHGNPELLTASASSRVTITGARAATAYGVHVTQELAEDLAALPRIIVSGGAYGIDAAAHRAALTTGPAATMVISASGLDRPNPNAHAELFERIVVQAGIQISETPPGQGPSRERFVARSRLLAALSGATIITEAAANSGSLLVAARAFELGRPVGAVPGPVTSVSSAGCHRLMREGIAETVTRAGEVAELMDPSPFPLAPAYQQVARRAAPDHSRAARRLAL